MPTPAQEFKYGYAARTDREPPTRPPPKPPRPNKSEAIVGLDREWAEDGYIVLTRMAQTSGTDGSGYTELRYKGHTYGRTPEEWLKQKPHDWRHDTVYHFIKISDMIRLKPNYSHTPERHDLTEIVNLAEPISNIRWMVGPEDKSLS